MPTDDQPHYPDPKNVTEEEPSFDTLAKVLATGTLTRGRVLKLAGAAFLGSVFGSLFGLPASEAQSQSVGGGGGQHHHHHHHHHRHHKGCPSGTMQLSNGTCALPCTQPSDPQCCNSCCLPWQANPNIGFCSATCQVFPSSCGLNGDSACPKGQFCNQFGFCTPVC